MEQRIDAVFSKWQKGICPGGQVVVRKAGKLIYGKNFGYANLEHEIPIKDETVFHVASMSKQITVMCVLLLQEEGQLHIDDDVRSYIPEYIHFDDPVTIRNMINNVSGIRDQWELLALSGVRIVDTITQRDALSIISKQEHVNFEPQSEFLYSNSNFTLLAEIVERISGQTLNEFAQERIFKPLGMRLTFFKDQYWKITKDNASSYDDDGTGEFVNSVLNYGTYGATSLHTTAKDFLKWMEQYNNPTICHVDTVKLMWETPTLKNGMKSSYAGGLFVGEYKGYEYIEHGGADASYRSAMLRFPDKDVDIVILSNTENLLMRKAAFELADIVLGLEEHYPKVEPNEAYRGEFSLEEVEGYYVASWEVFMTFELSLNNQMLHLKTSYGHVPLTHISGNHFTVDSLNIDFFLGEQSYIRVKDKLVLLKKVKPFKPMDSSPFLGKYESKELDTYYEIIEKEGILHIAHSRNEEKILYQIDENRYVTDVAFSTLLEFIEEQGRITGVILTGNRAKNIVLMK